MKAKNEKLLESPLDASVSNCFNDRFRPTFPPKRMDEKKAIRSNERSDKQVIFCYKSRNKKSADIAGSGANWIRAPFGKNSNCPLDVTGDKKT
ncbi:hypothetical protein AVEN_262177-1 [Araneus ventricosus]|uniref:Uncharacterized protein n=1 Tax=Araneus ventricosus TaxID=182803 RepID=A0A4Y2I5B0_ARAVE|nr:hypothetical protein AVEN_262177-1 [Araneus ventricosus]